MSKDITAWLNTQCETLDDFVCAPGVPLMDVMNSLEIGTSMDTGRNVFYPPFPHNVPLSTEELCWIMDEMTALEYLWWSGGTLCQTVYTSLAYHNIERIESLPLRAYAVAYAKSVDLVYQELSRGHVNDGEDCWLDHYGLSVNLSDPAENVIELLDQALHQADGLVAERLNHRRWLLSFLDHKTYRIQPLPPPVTSPVRAFFADVSSCVRQCMPLSPTTHPARDVLWPKLSEAYREMSETRRSSAELDWQLHLQDKAHRPPSLAITRSLYKSAFIPRRGQIGLDTDAILRQWLVRHTSIDLRSLGGDRDFALWRDLLHGCLISTLTIPLQNRSRQYRSYMSMSYAWYERSLTAKRLFPQHPSIAACLAAARLDCLIEASLAAFDLNLITTSERPVMWWWINEVGSSRCDQPLNKTWESTKAYCCTELARARLEFVPISRNHFEKRFKWALKAGSCPSFDDYVAKKVSEPSLKNDKAFADLAAYLNGWAPGFMATVERLRSENHHWR